MKVNQFLLLIFAYLALVEWLIVADLDFWAGVSVAIPMCGILGYTGYKVVIWAKGQL